MKQLLLISFLFLSLNLLAQPSQDYAVQTWAELGESPTSITINWKPISGASTYNIHRKLKESKNWGAPIATVDAGITTYLDTEVIVGVSYEYQIQMLGSNKAFGYINAGIEIPAVHERGGLLLLVDSTFSVGLASEISVLIDDFIGDGWEVIRHDINRDEKVSDVKQIVIDEYFTSNGKLKAVFCLGHIPVPYSGNYAPDGHTNNHVGAWPADGYYGDIDGLWTDLYVNNITASHDRTHNIPGDGKFDQLQFASELELQVGRVDFAKLNAFFFYSQPEEELMRSYLNKDHAFKHGKIKVKNRAIIDDNFGGFNGEAFAGSAWKSFAPLLHPDSVSAGDYRIDMNSGSYMWSYGCGPGSYSSCKGVGTTFDFAKDSLQGIFSAMFGSYFGDWDSGNNLLRATLAQGTILTNCWSGRPHWYFHHMGLGENIGYSTLLSMNNKGYFYNTPLAFLGNIVSMGLMGDPTLRMQILAPPTNLTSVASNTGVKLNWIASSSIKSQYFIYRSNDHKTYELLTENPISGISYTDSCPGESGTYYYMVRATELETTPSGSFYNLSQGIFSSLDINPTLNASYNYTQSSGQLLVTNTSMGSTNWYWDFGDGTNSDKFEPIHNYDNSGTYEVILIASNGCFQDTFTNTVIIEITNTDDLTPQFKIEIFPNPFGDQFVLRSQTKMLNSTIKIIDSNGRIIYKIHDQQATNEIHFSTKKYKAGIYFIHIEEGENKSVLKILKQ